MIIIYWYKRFIISFIAIFSLLLVVFSCSDLFVRLASLPSFHSLPKLMLFLMPLVAVFAFPLASFLAVQAALSASFIADEIVLYFFLYKLRIRLNQTVFLFACTLTFIFAPLVLYIAPTSYWNAKACLVNSIKEQLFYMQPNTFHTIIPGCMFFFKERSTVSYLQNVPMFKNIVLSLSDAQQEPYFINAQHCYVYGDTLILEKGTVYHRVVPSWYVGNFERTEISLEKFFMPTQLFGKKSVKFLNIEELYGQKKSHDDVFAVECHKRIAQILWQLCMPFFALWLLLAFGEAKSNLLMNICIAGGLFLYSYLTVNGASLFPPLVAYFLFYGALGFAIIVSYLFYKRKWH